MDALVQDPAERLVALDDEDGAETRLPRGVRRGEPRGTAADDDELIMLQRCAPPFVSLVRISLPGSSRQTSSQSSPSSRTSSSWTFGEQKPP